MKSVSMILAASLAAFSVQVAPVMADSYGYPAEQVARGKIINVRTVEIRSGASQADKTGAEIVGGLAGAILGGQFGKGSGKVAMAGAGAVGGALLGNRLAQNSGGVRYAREWTVRLDHGGTVSILQESRELYVGEWVHVVRDERGVRIVP